MPTQTFNAIQSQDKRKGANKRQKLTAQDMAIASFVFSQGDSAYRNAGSEKLGYDGYTGSAGESEENIQAMRDRSMDLIDHLDEIRYGSEGTYDERVGDVEVETSLLEDVERDTIRKRNAISGGLRSLFGDRISNYKAFGASFSEFGRGSDLTGPYQKVYTDDIMDIAPGVSIDAASMELKGNRDNDNKKNITIELLEGGKMPRLNLFTGVSGVLMDFNVESMKLYNTGTKTDITLSAGLYDNRPLVEKLSPKLNRKLTFAAVCIDTSDPQGIKMGKPVVSFVAPTVEYEEESTELGINKELRDIQKDSQLSAEFVAGSGMIIKDSDGKDTYTVEKQQINSEKALEKAEPKKNSDKSEAEEDNDPFSKLGEYKTQAELAEEKEEAEKDLEFEDYTFDPLHQFGGMGKVKGLSGTVQGNDRGQSRIELKFSATGDMIDYINPAYSKVVEDGETKNVVVADKKGSLYDNFFDFLLGNSTQADKEKIVTLKKKIADGEELTFSEMLKYQEAITKPSIAQQVGEIFGRTFLGDFITDLGMDILDGYKLNNADGIEETSFTDMLMYHFLGDHLATLLGEFMSGPDEEKPAIQYLKKYIKNLIGLSDDGKSVKPFEDSETQENIEFFPYMFDEAAMDAKTRSKDGVLPPLSIRVPIFPGGIVGASLTPFFKFSPSGGLEIEPSGSSFSEAKKAFKEDVLGKGKSPDELKKSDLEDSFKKCYKDVGYVIKPSIGANVTAGANARAYVMAGAGMILSARAELDGKLSGTAGVDIAGAFKLSAPEGYLKLSGLKGASIKGSVSLGGEVGMKMGLVSELLSWEYNVLEISLFKAALKELSIGVDMSLEEGAGDFANFGTLGAVKYQGTGFQNALEKEGAEKFTLEKVEVPRGMQTMLDEASAFNGGFEELRGKVNSILKVLLNKDYLNAIDKGGAPSFEQLKSVFAKIAEKLTQRNEDLINSVVSLTEMKRGYTSGNAFQKKLKFITDRIRKHTLLKERMEGYDPSNASHGSALSYYKKGRFFDGQNDFEKDQKEKKIEALANSDSLSPEGKIKKRYQVILEEKLAKDLEKNNMVLSFIKSYNPDDPGALPFEKYYKNVYKRVYGDRQKSAIYKHLGVSDVSKGSKERLLKFETKRGEDKSKKHVENLAAIRNFIKQKKMDPMAPSKEFSNWYFKSLLGVSTRGNWLKRQAVDYLSPKMLLAVMNKKLRDKAVTKDGNSILERIAVLERFKAEYIAEMDKIPVDGPSTTAHVDRVLTKAREFFFSPKGRKEEFKKHFYRTGTKEQILEYESSWKNKSFTSKTPAQGDAQEPEPQVVAQESGPQVVAQVQVQEAGPQIVAPIQAQESGPQIVAPIQAPQPGPAPQVEAPQPEATKTLMEKEAALLEKLEGFLKDKKGIEDVADLDKGSLAADLEGVELKLGDNKGVKLTGIGFWRNRRLDRFHVGGLNHVSNIVKVLDSGSKSSVGKRRELIAKSVSLDTIIRYEQRRADDENLSRKKRERHTKVLGILRGRRAMLLKETDPERVEKILEDLRADYFSGKIDLAAGKEYTGVTHLQLLKDIEDGRESDFAVLAALLKKDQESFRTQHVKRTEQVSKMLSDNSDMSDLEAYYKYHDQMRDYLKVRRLFNVRGGYEDYVKEQFLKRSGENELNDRALEKLSIDEMIRYEKRKMAENSRSVGDYLGTRLVDRMTSILPGSIFAVDKDKDKEANALYMEGYYGLYEKMQSWYNNAEGKDEEEKAKNFSKAVRENLLAGAFGKRGFFNDFLNELPPMAAIEYEEKRAREEKEKFLKRQEMIEKMGGVFPDAAHPNKEDEALTPQDLERYLTASRIDNTFKRITTRDKNYQTAYDEYLEKKFNEGEKGILNKELATNYHNRLELEIAGDCKKIELAINALGDTATEEDKLQAFMKNGGAKIIMDDPLLRSEIEASIKAVNESELVEANAASGQTRKNMGAKSCAEIIEYEKSRIKHYEDLGTALKKPVEEMETLIGKLEDNSSWANEVITSISKTTPEQIFVDHAFLHDVEEIVKVSEEGEKLDMSASEKLAFALEELDKLKV